jgi:hypothetical protein
MVRISDFQPMYHSSYNMMRDMVIKFEKNKATGYYFDKKAQKKDIIDEEFLLNISTAMPIPQS